MAMEMDYTKFLKADATGGDPFNYEAFRKTIGDLASQTREVSGTEGYQAAVPLYESIKSSGWSPGSSGSLSSYLSSGSKVAAKAQAEAGMAKARGDIQSLQGQADKASAGLEVMGAGMEAYMKRLQSAQDFAATSYQSAAEGWGAAAEKADEYVQASRARVAEVLSTLDETHQQIGRDRDFARAHAMQAGVQATLGSMKAEERNILQNYGADSAEYNQFVQSKGTALATMASNIHTNYQQLAETASVQHMMATNEAMWKQNMYTSFQEQQHVEMLKFLESSKYQYAMEKAKFDVEVEQLRMAGMENVASWFYNTPNFMYDAMPIVDVLAEVANSMSVNRQLANMMSSQRGGFSISPLYSSASSIPAPSSSTPTSKKSSVKPDGKASERVSS